MRPVTSMQQTGNLYADLSAYYDQFCAGIDYAQQCDFTRRAFDCFASSGGRDYLDLACGTGAHIDAMQGYGFHATGLDINVAMLAQARQRCPDAAFVLADMAELDAPACYDLISCFLYSIHYNHPLQRLQQTLYSVYAALKPGGVFVFNMVDRRGISGEHLVSTQVDTADGRRLDFRSGWICPTQPDADHSRPTMYLQLSIADTALSADASSATRVWHDRHNMSAIQIDELQAWLQQTGFDVTLLEHDYSRLRAWDGRSFNVLVVAVKPNLG